MLKKTQVQPIDMVYNIATHALANDYDLSKALHLIIAVCRYGSGTPFTREETRQCRPYGGQDA